MRTIRIGSRESRLAVIQAEFVLDYLRQTGFDAELVTMKTTGDRILDRTLDKVGGKGLFVKELDQALFDKKVDLTVHSLKDVPMDVPGSIPLLGFSKREDPRDALILPEGQSEIDFSKPIGCSSNRRIAQIKRLFPQAVFEPIRGNVQTRLRKLDSGQYSATILAAAGLKRLGLQERISRIFSVQEIIPAAGQGVLAVQGRAAEDYSYLDGYFDRDSRDTALCERAFVAALNGGCSAPTAAYAEVQGDQIALTGFAIVNGQGVRLSDTAERSKAQQLGESLARRVLQKGKE